MLKKRRYGEMDFARAIPLLFLPIVHCYEEFSWWEYLQPGTLDRGEILLFLCAFGPSIFMLILGMNIAFTSHNSPAELAKRGIKTLIIGELLNLVRYILPALVNFLMGHEYEADSGNVLPPFYWLIDGLESSAMSDILIFAGLAFLFFALMKKCKIPPFGIILISLVLLSVHTLIVPDNLLCDVEVNPVTYVTNELIGNFVHVTEDSAFPLLAWLIYPAIGFTVGEYMQTLPDKKSLTRFYGKTILFSAVALFSLCVCLYSYDLAHRAISDAPLNEGDMLNFLIIAAAPANSNLTDLFNVLLDVAIAGVAVGALALLYYAIEKVAPQWFLNFVNKLSRSIMIFYILQWIFVGWMEYLMAPYVEAESLGDGFVLTASIVIMLVSLVLCIPIKTGLDKKAAKAAAQG